MRHYFHFEFKREIQKRTYRNQRNTMYQYYYIFSTVFLNGTHYLYLISNQATCESIIMKNDSKFYYSTSYD